MGSWMRNSRPLEATSAVIFELKPFEESIRGAVGSEPWVGRSNAKKTGNSKLSPQLGVINLHFKQINDFFITSKSKEGKLLQGSDLPGALASSIDLSWSCMNLSKLRLIWMRTVPREMAKNDPFS